MLKIQKVFLTLLIAISAINVSVANADLISDFKIQVQNQEWIGNELIADNYSLEKQVKFGEEIIVPINSSHYLEQINNNTENINIQAYVKGEQLYITLLSDNMSQKQYIDAEITLVKGD